MSRTFYAIAFIAALCCPSTMCGQATADSLGTDDIDTLRTVVVTGNAKPAVQHSIDNAVREMRNMPRVKSLGEILNERFPNLMDCILHPFAFKARREERRHRRTQKALREYDMLRTPNELLMEAIRTQQLEDSILAARRAAEE